MKSKFSIYLSFVIITALIFYLLFAEYWLNLGENVMFDGFRLVECIARIRDDVLKIWNFYDPLRVSYVLIAHHTQEMTHIPPDTLRGGIFKKDD
jgi:hypothetical protein